jgi:hypothetical protein
VKNFAWEGDTVAHQPREVNYPTLPQLLARHHATIAFIQFGQTEALAGTNALAAFRHDYGQLLDTLSPVIPRLVLVTPTRWETTPSPLPVHTERNTTLAKYVDAIRELGAARHLPVIDVFTVAQTALAPPSRFTSDGRQLTPEGRALVAARIAQDSGGSNGGPGRKTLGFESAEARALQSAVVAKNQLWFHYVRPTNWAFLGGDRTDQLSSRDHRDKNLRWFPQEMEQFVPLLEAADERIDALTSQSSTPTTR